MKEAPLFTRAYDLHTWLLDRLENSDGFPQLRDRLLARSSQLLEAITLALRGFDRQTRALEADEALALLRLHLKLAEEKLLLKENQYRYALEELDAVGRQLGGWLKHMERV